MPEAPQVDGLVVWLIFEELRRRVEVRADPRLHERDPLRGILGSGVGGGRRGRGGRYGSGGSGGGRGRRGGGGGRRRGHLGQPKVAKLHERAVRVFEHEHILRLHVSMHNRPAVQVRERGGELDDDGCCVRLGQPALALEQVVQRCRAGVAVQGDTIFHSQLAVQAPPAITADGLTIYLISYIRKRDVTRWLWAGCPDWWWLAAVEPSGAEYIGTVHRTHVEGHLLVNDRRVDYVYDDRAPPPECILEKGHITSARVLGQVQHAMAPPPNNVLLLPGLSKNRLPATERVIELLRQALANGLLINQAGLEAVTEVCQAGCGTTNGKIPFCGTMQIAYASKSFTDKCIERKQFGYGEGQVARELWGGIDVFMFQLEAVLSDQNTYYDNNLDLAEYQLQGRILGGELDGPRTYASEDGPLISGRIIAIKALHGPRLDGYPM